MKLMNLLVAAAFVCVSATSTAANKNIPLKHCYDRDAQGRITTRTAYAWNGEDWQPALQWTYTYTATGYCVELSRWNQRQGRYDEPISKVIYDFTPDMTAAYVSTYTRENPTDSFRLTDSLLAAYPDKTPLDFIAHNN
jgi:hypothetical protein